jgi:uncharacterized protein YcbX
VRLVELHVFPLKGARGVSLERADVLAGGLRHDRRLMLLDARGEFVTQRKHPKLALVTTAFVPGGRGSDDAPARLAIGTPAAGAIEIDLAPSSPRPRRRVRIWGDEVAAVDVTGPVVTALSDHLGERCSLVYMPDDVVRPVEAPYGAPGDQVGFADAYPVLLASRSSLAELNARLDTPVPMNRFRPNLVVEGGEPYAEEEHPRVRIGALTFRMPKRCSRCNVTLVDQETAAVGKEPLRTLARYRTVVTPSGTAKGVNNVYFAQNLIPDGLDDGRAVALSVGDDVRYLVS